MTTQTVVRARRDEVTASAACRASDLDFHSDVPAEQVAAQAVCAACPVRVQCRALALDTTERWGVWGGMTADDRDRYWRAERRLKLAAAGRKGKPAGRRDTTNREQERRRAS